MYVTRQAEAYNNLGWLFWDHGDLAQAWGDRQSLSVAGLAHVRTLHRAVPSVKEPWLWRVQFCIHT